MLLTGGHIVGIAATLILMVAVGLYAGSKVKSAADFATGGRRAAWPVVAGAIMGTLVSGASTIGTAQLAFQYGFSAWWFTLGAGIACAVLGLGTARRFYEGSTETIPQYLVKTYGTSIGPVSTVFSALGIFLSLISQALAFIDSIRGILAGNRQALEQNYSLHLAGRLDQWTLTLLPRDMKIAELVLRITVQGSRGQLRAIEYLQADGDRTELRIEPSGGQ